MRLAFLALAASAYLVLLLVCPFYDPNRLPDGLRLLLLLDGAAFLTGVFGFLLSFTRPDLEVSRETQ